MPAAPQRSCIACRRKGEKGELIKLAAGPDGVVIDYGERLPGRGAYVCAEKACIEKGLNAGALSRAFKRQAAPPDKAEFYRELTDKIYRKIESLLGMARKSGLAAAGFDAAAQAAQETPGGVLIMAEDLSENTGSRFMPGRAESFSMFRYATKEGLGRSLGTAPVGLVYIKKSGLSQALGRELGRLSTLAGGEI